jgi:hypothetical protein
VATPRHPTLEEPNPIRLTAAQPSASLSATAVEEERKKNRL